MQLDIDILIGPTEEVDKFRHAFVHDFDYNTSLQVNAAKACPPELFIEYEDTERESILGNIHILRVRDLVCISCGPRIIADTDDQKEGMTIVSSLRLLSFGSDNRKRVDRSTFNQTPHLLLHHTVQAWK